MHCSPHTYIYNSERQIKRHLNQMASYHFSRLKEWSNILGYCVHSIGIKCLLTCVSLIYLFAAIQYAVFCKSLITFYVTLYIYISSKNVSKKQMVKTTYTKLGANTLTKQTTPRQMDQRRWQWWGVKLYYLCV